MLISGGLDLSVGPILAFVRVVAGLCLNVGAPVVLSILLGLLAAAAVGMVNGLLVSKMKINPYITTLGMMISIRGLLLVIAKGSAVLNLPESFTVVGQGRLFLGNMMESLPLELGPIPDNDQQKPSRNKSSPLKHSKLQTS